MSDEQDRWIAEHVMGWEALECDPPAFRTANGIRHTIGGGGWCPSRNPADALEALEAWCDADDEHRAYSISRQYRLPVPKYIIELFEVKEEQSLYSEHNRHWTEVGPTKHEAITAALCAATGTLELMRKIRKIRSFNC